ncbi:MAG: amidase protein [Bacillales bacterium]|jgi:hypothetical protein|nr:amidase protein [Bacillales bacterium]
MKKMIEEWVRKEAVRKLKSKDMRNTIKIIGKGQFDQNGKVQITWKYVMKQGDHFYISELAENRECSNMRENLDDLLLDYQESEKWKSDPLEENIYIDVEAEEMIEKELIHNLQGEESDLFYKMPRENRSPYNRHKAVHYAERWWNSRNPAYPKFKDDCTNYISQCLAAGGFPMTGFGNRNKGWWYRNGKYSFSWSVAHALLLFLAGSRFTREVKTVDKLMLGDIICYDFEGDGRFNHNTIITGRDANGQPLVNAHTYDSRQRYWEYKDSSAYTPKIRYRYFHILD